ncbi:MAG TPA: tripartite tricarboxylate transporter substrate binding protein [Xanthobacteraceae bacterium]|nr:tripartite tricarboxylate transporter substrate binding protein [Xanthobacteraceae bacterium]
MSLTPTKLTLSILAIASLACGAFAQSSAYPDRPVSMVVTFAAGGSSDVLARAVAEAMSHSLGQQIAVDNRPGAGGQIGAEAVAHAAPDGYTVLFGTNGTLGIGPALYKNLRYDPFHDLAPVGLLHKLPLLLIVNPSVPAKDLHDLIDYGRTNPGKLSFASAGVGSVSHLAGELFKEDAKIDILHVPYKGGGAAVTDLISGRVSMMLETIPNALPLARSGQMRAIAVTTKERSSSAPEIPTMAESGLSDFDVSAWTGLFVPGGTPRAVIDRLNGETRKIAGEKHYVDLIQSMGTNVAASSPEEFGAFVRDDVARWTKVIEHAGIQRIE